MVGTCLVRVLKGWESALAVLAKLLKFSCLTCVCLGAVCPRAGNPTRSEVSILAASHLPPLRCQLLPVPVLSLLVM